jgi:hypothetical protein
VEEQGKMIEIQGKEIADLKNQLVSDPQKVMAPYLPPQGEEVFKQHVLDVLKDFHALFQFQAARW